MPVVDHTAEGPHPTDRRALGMLITLPVAALLWLMIIGVAFELFKWVTAT